MLNDENEITTTTKIIKLGIIPNLASLHVLIIRTLEITTANTAKTSQKFLSNRKPIADITNNAKATNQKIADVTDISDDKDWICANLKPFAKPIK